MPEELLAGLEEFMQSSEASTLMRLAKDGQHPTALLISCMDSRCIPATVFTARPGKFFPHSPMGALVPHPDNEQPPSELRAKIKYAIEHVGVTDLIVVGHTQCGAINALINAIEDEDIAPWVHVAKGACDIASEKVDDTDDKEALQAETERQAVIQSVENLKQYPVVSSALKDEKIKVHGWLLDIADGHVHELDQDTKTFKKRLFSFEMPAKAEQRG